MESLAAVYVGLVVIGGLAALAERRWPAPRGEGGDGSRANDLAWWVFSPVVVGVLTRVLTMGFAFMLAAAAGHRLGDPGALDALRSRVPLRAWQWPLAAQWPAALLLADVLGYWSHRLRHMAWFWPFHAVHHAPERLVALAAARIHPVDDLADNVAIGLATLVLFDARVFEMLGPVLIVHTLFTHAAVPWRLGPLRWVLVSPVFHRWHHEASRASPGCNFAGMFSFLDLAFGTWHLPDDALPARFGAPDERVPDTLLGQLAYPFRAVLARMA